MSDIKDFMAKLKNKSALDNKAVAEAVDELFKAASPDDVFKSLIEAAQEFDFNENMLGYFLFPGLKRRADKDRTFLPAIQKLVERPGVPDKVRLHCIELLEKHYRKKQISYPTDYVDFICKAAVNRDIEDEVRARIARLLARVKGRKQLDALKALIDSNNADLVEGACHTLSRWSTDKLGRHGALVKQIIRFVKGSPGGAIKNPNVLRTLAKSNRREIGDVVDEILAYTKDEEDWLRLAACIGADSPTKQLAEIINGVKGVKEEMAPRAKITLRNLFQKVPDKWESLYKEKFYGELIDSIAADPSAISNKAIKYLKKIESKADPTIKKMAVKLKAELKTAKPNAFLPKDEVLSRKDTSALSGTQPTVAAKIRDSYFTGFHMGDALYRNTYLKEPFTHNHWHAGIFQTFEFIPNGGTGIDGHMQGVHITGFPGEIKPFEAQRGFGDPDLIVADKMKKLRDDFLEDFDVDDDHPFRGARRTPEMSKDDRLNLLSTSADLMNQGIHYTFWDMLVSWGDRWDGSISDIDLLRCDGVVEYTYEKCDKKVCAGTSVSLWNIAEPGDEHLESHADLHTWSLNPGELCPKVQAGDEGNDTTFIKPPFSVPMVQEFDVVEETVPGGKILAIKLNVQSNEYYTVYVRIIVKPPGGAFDFAITTGTDNDPPVIGGKWMFKEVDEGTNHVAYWQGDKSAGNYYNANGIYEFRAVAVDKGGNVSEEYSCKIPIDWSQLKQRPW